MKKRETGTKEDEKVQREKRERRKAKPIRRRGKGWKGEAAENAERQRGEGRGLDEPGKKIPPDELK